MGPQPRRAACGGSYGASVVVVDVEVDEVVDVEVDEVGGDVVDVVVEGRVLVVVDGRSVVEVVLVDVVVDETVVDGAGDSSLERSAKINSTTATITMRMATAHMIGFDQALRSSPRSGGG
jgi:hypothetical protein